ncbi:MAG: helix-turn-helix domain-containing protein [Terracidiphilus sp.]
MNNAMRKEDRRAVEGFSSVASIGARNDLYEAFPGKDRLTVRGNPEKTQSAAVVGAEPSRARLQAFPTGAFCPEPLLDSIQAAAIMQIHPKTLQKLARRGVIRALQIGKVWRFRASVLDEWIQQKLAG